jgi:hypothetical protein
MIQCKYIFEIIGITPSYILPSGALCIYTTLIAHNPIKWVYPSAEQKAFDKLFSEPASGEISECRDSQRITKVSPQDPSGGRGIAHECALLLYPHQRCDEKSHRTRWVPDKQYWNSVSISPKAARPELRQVPDSSPET